jgi:hypothetical protein
LAERNRNADVADRERRAAAPVQLLLHRERAAGELRAIVVVTFLDEHDGKARLGELSPDDRAARAGADDDDIALDRDVTTELIAAVHAIAHVGRLRLRARLLEVVDAAELLVELRIVEVGDLERADERAQHQATDRIAAAPALEQREPLLGLHADERAPLP